MTGTCVITTGVRFLASFLVVTQSPSLRTTSIMAENAFSKYIKRLEGSDKAELRYYDLLAFAGDRLGKSKASTLN